MGAVAVVDRPLLLDTVAFIFWHADSPRLGTGCCAMLEAPMSEPSTSSAATASKSRPKVRISSSSFRPRASDFAYVVEADGFRLADVDAAAAVRAGQLIGMHRDPFDRLISAQAQLLNASVVTNDAAFLGLGAETYW